MNNNENDIKEKESEIKKTIFLVFIVFILIYMGSIIFFKGLNYSEQNPNPPIIFEENGNIDDRIEITNEDFINNLKIDLISNKQVNSRYYYFKTENFVNGSHSNNTIIALKTSGVNGIDAYLKNIELYKKDKKITIDYVGYKIGNGDVLFLIGIEGIFDIKDSFIKIFAQSVNSNDIIEIKKEINSNLSKIDTKNLIEFGDVFSPSKDSYYMKLTKINQTVKNKNKYSRVYRFLSFGNDDKIDLSKFTLKNIKTGEKLPNEYYFSTKMYIEKGKEKELFDGSSNKYFEKSIHIFIETLNPNITVDDVENVFNNYYLVYNDEILINLNK